ncbi:alpha/beta fold hydrolase [Actinoplanes sp. G11-F43]|uniref:alpha/beta fold hydrolase n=1 Tax=Actinoplanes sp. G11-F43 TaxID=3424130 RepID=UPI003D33ADDE
MAVELLAVNGVTLAAERFGSPADPPVLLVAGAAAPMVSWPRDFCGRLAGAGRFVVRYDHRDLGRSTSYPCGAPGYRLADLAGDVIGLLDALDLPAAHLAGVSLGGQLAQLAALGHPSRVSSLTLVSTSPAALGSAGRDLPQPSLSALCALDDVDPPDWERPESVVRHLMALARIRSGGAFDEPAARRAAVAVAGHGGDLRTAAANHALLGAGTPWRERLPEIAVPTVVLHGDHDPLFPPAHGRALRDLIPGATLITLPDTGHDLSGAGWNELERALLAVSAGSS